MLNSIALLIVTGCNVALVVMFARATRAFGKEHAESMELFQRSSEAWQALCDEYAAAYVKLRERYEEREGRHDA